MINFQGVKSKLASSVWTAFVVIEIRMWYHNVSESHKHFKLFLLYLHDVIIVYLFDVVSGFDKTYNTIKKAYSNINHS